MRLWQSFELCRQTWCYCHWTIGQLDLFGQCLAGPLVPYKTIVAQLLERERESLCVRGREREWERELACFCTWRSDDEPKKRPFLLLSPSVLNKQWNESEQKKLHMPEQPSHRQAWSGFGSRIIYKSWILVPVQELIWSKASLWDVHFLLSFFITSSHLDWVTEVHQSVVLRFLTSQVWEERCGLSGLHSWSWFLLVWCCVLSWHLTCISLFSAVCYLQSLSHLFWSIFVCTCIPLVCVSSSIHPSSVWLFLRQHSALVSACLGLSDPLTQKPFFFSLSQLFCFDWNSAGVFNFLSASYILV